MGVLSVRSDTEIRLQLTCIVSNARHLGQVAGTVDLEVKVVLRVSGEVLLRLDDAAHSVGMHAAVGRDVNSDILADGRHALRHKRQSKALPKHAYRLTLIRTRMTQVGRGWGGRRGRTSEVDVGTNDSHVQINIMATGKQTKFRDD